MVEGFIWILCFKFHWQIIRHFRAHIWVARKCFHPSLMLVRESTCLVAAATAVGASFNYSSCSQWGKYYSATKIIYFLFSICPFSTSYLFFFAFFHFNLIFFLPNFLLLIEYFFVYCFHFCIGACLVKKLKKLAFLL